MNILTNHLIATISNKTRIKRIIDNIDQERRLEAKRNMREFIKNKCKKRGC